MAARKRATKRASKPAPLAAAQPDMLDARVKTAPCVPAIREAVSLWKASNYPAITDTTRTLLDWWFAPDGHRIRGRKFRYHPFQQEAIETLIYLYEIKKVRRQKALIETYANEADLQLLQNDTFSRYALKMATGTGKTKVMSLAIAWQYFNALLEGGDCALTSLIVAPNVIVFERLRSDFANGAIFSVDPVIPPSLKIYWDMQVYLRGEPERASSRGAVYLTNVQQLLDREQDPNADEPSAITAMLGAKPSHRQSRVESFGTRIADRGGNCLVINDEAHHTHDEDLRWNEIIRELHDHLNPTGGVIQLDMTATPRYSKGQLFTWTVYDYPLKQAIIDGIVKRPMKGLTFGLSEARSDIASVKYKKYLIAGVSRWREYRVQLAPLSKKPLLFVMLGNTAQADEVAEWLRVTYPEEFADDKLLVIHTNRSGDVSGGDESAARKAAREVDDPNSAVNAIVSVLMLREGWDVQNVTVIVGLRPFSAKANILPEQTIGRGLRLMFRGSGVGYTERLDVIGNPHFMKFVDQLEREEELQLERFDIDTDHVKVLTIAPDPAKIDKDITLPELTPVLARKRTLAEEISAIDVSKLVTPILPKKQGDVAEQTFRFEGYDIITLRKEIEREYSIPEPQTAEEVISYYAKRIAEDVKLPSQFAVLVPKVREFLETRAFGGRVSLEERSIIRAIASNVAHYVTVRALSSALRGLVIEELRPTLLGAGKRLSETTPFPWSRASISATKAIFNRVPCDNEFERRFAQFLQDAPDVVAFSKLPSQFGFAIEYTDNAVSLRYYEPDFVAILSDGSRHLVETKGREDLDVAHKDRAAALWCANATTLTGTSWSYLKVPQEGFKQLQPEQFEDLIAFEMAAATP